MFPMRLFPDTILSEITKSLSKNQFEGIKLEFDPGPTNKIDTSTAEEFKSIVYKVSPSIVRIATSRCGSKKYAFGSGSVVAPGLVITNQHVINGATSIYIVSQTGSYPAAPVLIDEKLDLAIIYSKYINLKPIPISTDEVDIGSEAITLGYPGSNNLALSMSVGTIKENTINSRHTNLDPTSTFSLSSSLGSGSSGGPVINKKGEIIGINDAGSGNNLIAIKAEVAKKITDQAKNKLFPAFSLICAYDRISY